MQIFALLPGSDEVHINTQGFSAPELSLATSEPITLFLICAEPLVPDCLALIEASEFPGDGCLFFFMSRQCLCF